MKKIMFNDKYGLTQAVLDGKKTMTRRIITYPPKFKGVNVAGYYVCKCPSGEVTGVVMHDEKERMIDGGQILPKYDFGDIVAIAQSYKDIDDFYMEAFKRKNSIHGNTISELDIPIDEINRWYNRRKKLYSTIGWANKMFVQSDFMPHHIRIIGVKVERLQDISDGDCFKEGINEDCKGVQYSFDSNIGFCWQFPFHTPRCAFAELIDRISGEGTWNKNPYVWVYEFENLD